MKISLRSSSLLAALVVGGGLMFSVLPARAQLVAFDNFGENDSFDSIGAWVVSGQNSSWGERWSPGFQFTAEAGGELSFIEVGVMNYAGSNLVTMALYTASSGLPGALLESWTATNLPAYGSASVPTTFTSLLSPVLILGDTYFLVASSLDGTPGMSDGSVNAWGFNVVGATGLMIENGGFNESVATQGAFRVTVLPVPEPATYGLFGAVALLGLAFWRRQSARR